jgi:two-component system, OmpR family, sensor histidine kinase KdpD
MMLDPSPGPPAMRDIGGQPSPGAPGHAKSDVLFRRLRLPEAPAPKSLKDYLIAGVVCAALVGVALGVGLVIEYFLRVPNILLVFLPMALLAAVRYGFWAASLTSVLSILAASFFTEPRYSFAVSDPGSVWALLIFLLVSALTSSLAAQIRQRAAAVTRHSEVIEQLYAFSSKLAALSATDELAREAAGQISSMLSANTMLLAPEHGALRVKASSAAESALDARELLAANWCWEHGEPAGRGTSLFPGVTYLYLPLDTSRGTVGVLGVHRAGEPALTADEIRLLDALRDQVAVSIDRTKLAEEKLETDMLAETERLRTALLTSISHDLRTPLASILGNISSLRRYGDLYDEPTRAEMLTVTEDETLRLNRFVENLLYMTRIDAGALGPTIENIDLSDLIGSALKRTEKRTEHHELRTDLPADLPMVPVDFVLAEHVFVNLLDNAAKYSPPASTITITVAEQADRLRVAIADEGPGITTEHLPRIFERFFRADVGDRRRAGVGLGLAICKGFVEAMGGEIKAQNRTDRSGAVLTVMLPKVRAEAQ